ncbi:MAG: quercetin 2,3-dioxygenase [Phycisphaerales bacterium]|nr:quercetin 2,3-dioxygenase [Phycisphaerales bacterium]
MPPDSPAAPAAVSRTAATLARLAVAGDLYAILVESRDTGGRYAMLEAIVPAGGGPPPHVHTCEDEGFYVLEGEVTFTVDGRREVASAGTLLHLPRNLPHQFRNESDRAARMLIWVTPGGFEQFFHDVGVPCPAGTAAPRPPSAEHFARIVERAPAYGVQILTEV